MALSRLHAGQKTVGPASTAFLKAVAALVSIRLARPTVGYGYEGVRDVTAAPSQRGAASECLLGIHLSVGARHLALCDSCPVTDL